MSVFLFLWIHALAIKQKKIIKKHVDEYWVVLDKDDTSKSDFLKAIKLAAENGLNVAYSCEAFEIWWLFHFMEIAAPIQCKDYEKKLQKHLPDYKFREIGLSQGERMWMQLDKLKTLESQMQKKSPFKIRESRACI